MTFHGSYTEFGTTFPPEDCPGDDPYPVSDNPFDDPDVRCRIGELIARCASAKRDDPRASQPQTNFGY
jgi:hypothetical protein